MSSITTALLSLKRNLMRSILTTLGIIIGISAVIVMFALGEGAQRQVQAQIESLGSNLLMVRNGSITSGGAKGAAGTRSRMELADLYAIQKQIPEVQSAAATVNGQAQVVWGNANWNTGVEGASADILSANNWRLSEGRAFSDAEVRSGAKVALMGQTVAKELFGDASLALGASVRVNKVPLKVIGLLEGKGQDMRGYDQDDTLIVPITTANRRVLGSSNANRVKRLVISVDSSDNMDYVASEVEQLLLQRHRLSANQSSAFNVMNLSAMMNTRAQANQVFNSLLAGVAAVSLLVGGIGVMNIMLVSVTERTREIGLRMAVGARPKDILVQFLVESALLCILGAIVGVLLSMAAIFVMEFQFGWPMATSPLIMLISVLATGIIGIGFGFYPAYKAANLDPIEALRYE
ncbi:ABC transporter permease [Paraferrimonas sedimenticola]|uniref:ABC transporter permease n=1 Tax=Paraferrimonas sedimenticola TaxID=375674 RepID=UPI001FE74BAE|nr:ABC transporter permease [Paraferrimonas sedimenticola]